MPAAAAVAELFKVFDKTGEGTLTIDEVGRRLQLAHRISEHLRGAHVWG